MENDHRREQIRQFVSHRLQELERLAVDNGTTIEKAARSVGVSRPTLWRWQSGKTEPGIFKYHELYQAVANHQPKKGKRQ